ncbi:MAG: hypothetical protein J3Q66DRAFT_369385 [Benniella sp.]|nr:MAG: hypothetical protein J3Q66DRAFT_369385 [Benniella sp.]
MPFSISLLSSPPQWRSASSGFIGLERLRPHLALTTIFHTYSPLADHSHREPLDNATLNQSTSLKLILSLEWKRAQEAVRNIVTRRPLMILVHPGMKVVVQITLQILKKRGNGVPKAGGIISSERVDDMEGAPSETQATISEYFTMVTAGLAGTTPHMVSAAITSLSRLLFEFSKNLDPAMAPEISTMHLFVNSSYREIVKSALGFIKVTTISLDVEIVRLHLQEIVRGIIRWSHEHKGHFKVKVRHILERLVRRFGYDNIDVFVPEADKKLSKHRERAKRKKANASEMEMDGEADEEGEETTKKSNKPQTTFGSAYEDALYGSESDLSDDDDDQEEDDTTGKTTQKKSNEKKQGADAWIKEDDDTPLDFLDRTVVSRVTASHPSTQVAPKVKDLSSAFKTSDGEAAITMPLDARKQQPVLGHGQAQDQSQERDSQEPQHAEGEGRESAIQSELETMRQLVKTMEATDLSMTETREKLKTFYKTADETNALLTCGFVYCHKRNMHKTASGSCLGRIQYRKEESRHRENQERRAAYQQAMESANSRRRSYGVHANHSTLTQPSFSVPPSSTTTTTAIQLSSGSIGASSGTSPCRFIPLSHRVARQ